MMITNSDGTDTVGRHGATAASAPSRVAQGRVGSGFLSFILSVDLQRSESWKAGFRFDWTMRELNLELKII